MGLAVQSVGLIFSDRHVPWLRQPVMHTERRNQAIAGSPTVAGIIIHFPIRIHGFLETTHGTRRRSLRINFNRADRS